MTKEEKQAVIDKAVGEIAEDLKPEVARIEAGVKTTMNNYGTYGALLSTLGKGNTVTTQLLALALVKAGANKQGVSDGLRLLCGIKV